MTLHPLLPHLLLSRLLLFQLLRSLFYIQLQIIQSCLQEPCISCEVLNIRRQARLLVHLCLEYTVLPFTIPLGNFDFHHVVINFCPVESMNLCCPLTGYLQSWIALKTVGLHDK